MSDLQKSYTAYRNELAKLNEVKDAWYTIAGHKFSEGDKEGQAAAYAEVNKIQAKINALVNPFEESDKVFGENEGNISF